MWLYSEGTLFRFSREANRKPGQLFGPTDDQFSDPLRASPHPVRGDSAGGVRAGAAGGAFDGTWAES